MGEPNHTHPHTISLSLSLLFETRPSTLFMPPKKHLEEPRPAGTDNVRPCFFSSPTIASLPWTSASTGLFLCLLHDLSSFPFLGSVTALCSTADSIFFRPVCSHLCTFSVCLSVCLPCSVSLSICLSVCLSVRLPVCMPVFLSFVVSQCLPVSFSDSVSLCLPLSRTLSALFVLRCATRSSS